MHRNLHFHITWIIRALPTSCYSLSFSICFQYVHYLICPPSPHSWSSSMSFLLSFFHVWKVSLVFCHCYWHNLDSSLASWFLQYFLWSCLNLLFQHLICVLSQRSISIREISSELPANCRALLMSMFHLCMLSLSWNSCHKKLISISINLLFLDNIFRYS